MAEKRVIEQVASNEVHNDDWFLKDSVVEGTTKISAKNLAKGLINNVDASDIAYDNSSSGLEADNVDGAIDELSSEKANLSDLAAVATSGSFNDLSNKPTIPDELADLTDDSTHRVVTDTEKSTWNGKQDAILQLPEATSYTDGMYYAVASQNGGTKRVSADVATAPDKIIRGLCSDYVQMNNSYDANNNQNASFFTAPFFLLNSKYDYYGKLIAKIKINVASTGVLSVGYTTDTVTSGGTADLTKIVVVNLLNITTTGVQEIELPKPFVVPNGSTLFVGNTSDTAIFKYGMNGTPHEFYYISSEKYNATTSSINIDFYELKSKVSGLEEEVNYISDTIENLFPTEKIMSGYDASNITGTVNSNSPFIPTNRAAFYDYLITKIKINVASTGTLSIGYTTDDVASGNTADRTKAVVTNSLNITTTGVQEIELPKPFVVPNNAYFFIMNTTDSCALTYGVSGTDKGFFYISSGSYSISSASLNIDIWGIKTQTISSIYQNKTLSILGDSISTYEGYIPEGNVTYYPQGTVQNVSDTWWYKLLTALGMTLNVNNSWSGSRVTTTAGETSAGCMSRCENLGTNPDVIIVYMGINDFNNEVSLGTYDGSTEIPTVTTTFREAYGIMLNKILTKYQTSEVWVATLPQCERNGETGFPEINGNNVALVQFNKAIKELAEAFGVKVLDHNKCGLTYQNMPTFNPDNLHPNKNGHSLIANNDIHQMDNTVRKRY